MAVACGAHVLHDGYTDLFYVLLPIWQAECGLGYAEIGALRALYGGSMASFQVPAGIIAERLGGPLILGLGTALSAKLLKPVRLPPGRTMSHACRWRLKAEKGPQERRRVLFGLSQGDDAVWVWDWLADNVERRLGKEPDASLLR